MTGKIENRVIQNNAGKTVAVMRLKESALDGKCAWYNGQGGLIAYGFFKNGKPWAGTFLNWTLFMQLKDKTRPYNVTNHCQDWVSLFEASYDSETAHYLLLVEVYSDGNRIDGDSNLR